ncbi:DUF3168 domain-containing protein [Phyllobacterium myrsinacearum]|uniref:DUF3168 domain-containing protein n=1 Tax=Phyllobacterium myrsinacearum TaxID=28101 RepID=A0A2S9JEE5_9HYPH|nr:DUF3168 domain-containing protein [Phyllobacterium myrsinacearum]PRD51162.1 DUF3168 domain-containing protein [Phyllobacterium myrsinacearum]PWV86632.1 uncharacterized protein DUF3168 [Phyllobacterium myrsinacearum]RZU97406.1 uncharacterized protein DUF3168 [Phyllobacterium myrsinacearum]
MTSAGLQLQKALLQALKADAGLNEWVNRRVFDHVPQQAEFPYVTFGTASTYDWSTSTERGGEHLLTLHVWTHRASRKTVFDIVDRIERLLLSAPLALEGHTLVSLRLEYTQTALADSRDSFAGIMRYRAVTEDI